MGSELENERKVGMTLTKAATNLDEILQRMHDDPVYFCSMTMESKPGQPFVPFDYQAELMRSKSKRIAACWGRQTGKTWSIAGKAIHFAYTHPKSVTLIVSRGLRQSMIMFSVIADFVMDSKILKRSVTRYTRTQIELHNGARIVALPCSQNGANLRGYTADMVIMDEAAFMPEPVIAGVIFPMLATTEVNRGTGIAIMISTPWGKDHIFYRCFTNPTWFVRHVKSERSPLITDAFLKEQRQLVGELRYITEYEAQFREDATSVFPQDLIRGIFEADWYDVRVAKGLPELVTDIELVKLDGKFTGKHCLGLDIGKHRDYSVVTIFKKSRRTVASSVWQMIGENDDDLATQVINPAWIMVYRNQYELGTRLTDVMNHVIWLLTKFDIRHATVDKTQIGEMPFETIQDVFPIAEGVYLSAQEKQSVLMALHLMVEQRRIGIPVSDDYRDIITQMAEQQYGYSQVHPRAGAEELSELGIMKFWHPEGRKDDVLWSMALAIYGVVRESVGSSSGVK